MNPLPFLAAVLGGFVAIVVGLVNLGEEISCRTTAEAMGVEWRYSFTTPCLIKPEGKPWVPLKSYRVF